MLSGGHRREAMTAIETSLPVARSRIGARRRPCDRYHNGPRRKDAILRSMRDRRYYSVYVMGSRPALCMWASVETCTSESSNTNSICERDSLINIESSDYFTGLPMTMYTKPSPARSNSKAGVEKRKSRSSNRETRIGWIWRESGIHGWSGVAVGMLRLQRPVLRTDLLRSA